MKRENKELVRYGYALLDNSKRTVSIDDIDRPFSRLHKFYCPHCCKEMYATFGEVQLPHFRHNGEKCQHSNYLHDLAEHVFYEEYFKCLDNGWPFVLELRIPIRCNKACVLKKHVDCSEHYIRKSVDLTKDYTLISLETRVGVDERFRRPDVLLETQNGEQLWVEIWVSHETVEDKRKDGRIIEIKIDTEKDLEMIRRHRIVQSEEGDLAVRIFNIESDGVDALIEDKNDFSNIKYPCEYYYCFEVDSGGFRSEALNYIKTSWGDDLKYRIILKLNWNGDHRTEIGFIGDHVNESDLRSFCIQRYSSRYPSYGKTVPIYQNEPYELLIVNEKKAENYNPNPIHYINPYRRQTYKPIDNLDSPNESSLIDVSNVEWVDLGLPSGVLWAKNDMTGIMSIKGALNSFGVHVPSKSEAYELRKHCTRQWDNNNRALVFTGPNGNSISFSCKESDRAYWLNDYEKGDRRFGQCFRLGPDKHFWINDKESDSAIYIHLVKR